MQNGDEHLPEESESLAARPGPNCGQRLGTIRQWSEVFPSCFLLLSGCRCWRKVRILATATKQTRRILPFIHSNSPPSEEINQLAENNKQIFLLKVFNFSRNLYFYLQRRPESERVESVRTGDSALPRLRLWRCKGTWNCRQGKRSSAFWLKGMTIFRCLSAPRNFTQPVCKLSIWVGFFSNLFIVF